MDLLERYLQAIGQYLPEEARMDTLAELRANLLEQMDARAEDLGRPLHEDDVAAILRAHGKPEAVALRYLPQRSLIGPTVFPFYTFTLKRVLPLVVFVSALAEGIEFVSSAHETLPHALVGFASGLAYSLLITAAIITGIFVGIEWGLEHGKLGAQWNEWDPARLPALKPHAASTPTVKATIKRALDLVLHCLWMAYVLWVPWHPFWLLGPGVFYLDSIHVALAPAWHTFYTLLIVVMSLQLVMRVLSFVPSVQRAERPAEIVNNLLGMAVTGWLAAQSVYFVPASPAADLQRIADVNQAIGLAFRVVLVFVVIGFFTELWKYAKRWKPLHQPAF